MAGDTIGSGETFDGGDIQSAPDVPEPVEAAADYANPVAETRATISDQESGDDLRDLSDFEPEEGDTDSGENEVPARPLAPAPAESAGEQPDAAEDDFAGADAAAARARKEADRQALPAEQTRTYFDGPEVNAAPPPAPAAPKSETKASDDTNAEPPQGPATKTSPEADDKSAATDGNAPDRTADHTGDRAGEETEVPPAAAAVAGRAAVLAEVDVPDQATADEAESGDGSQDRAPAEDEEEHSEVAEVDEVISEHDRDAEASGRDEMPEIDLQELEDLMELIEPDSALILSQHDWTEDDDSWAEGRDAASSGPMAELNAFEGGQDNVVYPDFAPTAADTTDNDQTTDGTRSAPLILLNRNAEPAAEPTPAGDWIDEVLPDAAEDMHADTPQGARPYPPALVDITDALMMQGDEGEERAMKLLEHYDATGQMPEGLIPQPAPSPEAETEEPRVEPSIPLF